MFRPINGTAIDGGLHFKQSNIIKRGEIPHPDETVDAITGIKIN